jgi:hypothetical protein
VIGRHHIGLLGASLLALGVLDPFTSSHRHGHLRQLEMCIELRGAGVRPKDVQALAETRPWPFDEYARVALMEHDQRCRTIPGYREQAANRLRRYKQACRARSLLSFASAVAWSRQRRHKGGSMAFAQYEQLDVAASWAMAEALTLQPARHLEGLLSDAKARWYPRGNPVPRPSPVKEIADLALLGLNEQRKRREFVIYDDVVNQEPTAEQRAKMEAWYEQAMARGKRTTLADLRAAGATIGQDFAARPDAAVVLTDPQTLDLNPMYDLGARKVTIGLADGTPLAHVTLRDREPSDIKAMRPVLGKAIALEVNGRRGPGRQLRDERERVGEPLRVLAAYAGLTTVELGEIERGLRIPTPKQWAALQDALPDLGEMEAPATEAERRPTVPQPNLHPAGRCTCAGEGTCEWCEMDRRRELREARKSKRAALQASLGAQALRGVQVDHRTAKQERRAAKARKRARKGWA